MSKTQHDILVYITESSYRNSDDFFFNFQDACLCGTKYYELFHPLMIVFANILLNNSTKQVNDAIVAKKQGATFEKWKKQRDLKALKELQDKEKEKENNQEENSAQENKEDDDEGTNKKMKRLFTEKVISNPKADVKRRKKFSI